MRVAALYDIHGNLPALRAVLQEVERESVDRIVIGGDVSPGPMAKEALDTLAQLPVSVRYLHGNGELAVLAAHRGEEITGVPERVHESIRWVAQRLPSKHLAGIATWPPTIVEELSGGNRVLFCHATPRNATELFTRATPEERLRPVFEPTGADLVVCGHTHMQFDRRIGAVRVVNAGSVGLPFGEPGAYWLLLADGEVELRRAEYDLEEAERRLRATDYPGASDLQLVAPPSREQMEELFEQAALG